MSFGWLVCSSNSLLPFKSDLSAFLEEEEVREEEEDDDHLQTRIPQRMHAMAQTELTFKITPKKFKTQKSAKTY